MTSRVAMVNCSVCGREFGCGADGGQCWCAALPVASICDPEMKCLCPACLGARTGASLAQLPGLGPISQARLEVVGIRSISDLAELGAVAAFKRTKQAFPRVSLNLLWALEAALSGRNWQLVARDDRARLLLALDAPDAGAPD